MTTDYALSLADEINVRLDPAEVLSAIDFHADKLQQAGSAIKAFCPIHQDSRFRSLLVDGDRKAFRCTIKTCPGYEGGSLVELYALSKKVSPVTGAFELAEKLNIELGTDWRDQLALSYLEESSAARDAEDYTQADMLLRELISFMPDQVDARIMLATLQADLGDPQAAAEEYMRLIDYLLSQKKLEQADAAAEKAIELFPDNEDIQFARVRIAEEGGKHSATIERMQEIVRRREETGRHLDNIGLLEQLVLKAPYEPELALKLAGLYEQQHNVRGASRQYENAARVYLAAGNKASGIEMLERVVQFNGENIRARLDLARELAEFGDLEKSRNHTFRAVNQQIDQQEFGNAVATVQGWMEREPESIESRELLARIFLDQDRPAEAASFLVEGAGIASRQDNHQRSADLLLRAKFLTPDDAVIRQKLIEQFRASGEAQRAGFEMVDLAEILFTGGASDEAATLLRNGIESEISLPLKLQMASSLANHNMHDDARASLEGVAREAESSGTPEEMAELYELLSRLDFENVDYHRRLVEVLWDVNHERAGEAAADSAAALLAKDLAPQAEQVLETITGRYESYLHAAPRLLELCERCERIDLAGLIYQLSIQGFAEDDAEAALKAARRMAALDPNHASASSDIAFLLASLGRTEEAANQYARVSLQLRNAGDFENAHQFAREAAGLCPHSVPALACQALTAREVLTPAETQALADILLDATRQTNVPQDAASGYLAYTELYPDDDALLAEAAKQLESLGASEGAARIKARQASRHSIQGNWNEASTLLRSAWEMAPGLPDVAEQFGEVSHVLGNKDEAAAAYSSAADAFARQQDMASGRRCAEQALNCDPTEAAILEQIFQSAEATGASSIGLQVARQLALRFRENGPPASAARWAREWVRLAPASPEAFAELGAALVEVDQTDSAVDAFSAAAALFHNSNNDERALAALQQMDRIGPLSSKDNELLSAILANADSAELRARASLLRGRTFVESGELEQARTVARALAKSNRTELTAELWSLVAAREINAAQATEDYLYAAQADEAAGRTTQAIGSLKAAYALSPAHSEVLENLVRLLEVDIQPAEAFPLQLSLLSQYASAGSNNLALLLGKLRKQYGRDIEAQVQIARTLVAAGQPGLALQDLESAAALAEAAGDTPSLIAICSVDEDLTRQSTLLTRGRADALMGMENEEQALEWVRSSSQKLMAEGKFSEAQEMARRWISLNASDTDALSLTAEAAERLGQKAEAANARLSLAQNLSELGRMDDALIEVRKSLDLVPTFTQARRFSVALLKQAGRSAEAALQLHELADYQASEGDSAGALDTLLESQALDRANVDIAWKVAELTRTNQGLAASLPLYKHWISLRQSATPQADLIADLEVVRTIAPESVGVLRDYTEALIAAGRGPDAAGYLEELAFLHETEGDYASAAETLETMLQHSPVASAERYAEIARLYERGASPARAQEYYRSAATTWLDQGKPDQAVAVLERVVKLSDDSPLPEDLAVLARACSRAGQLESAETYIARAVALLGQVSGNAHRREILLTHALEISPLNADYVLQHMDMLPAGRAMAEGLRTSRQMASAGLPEDAVRVLTKLISLAPHDMSLRQELFEPLRKSGNSSRLRQELVSLATDAIAAGDTDAANEALSEATTLATTANHFRTLGEVYERARLTELSAAQFAHAALLFARENKTDQSIATINRAISARPSAVDVELMAELVKIIGEPVHDVAREQLRSALTARRQRQSQVLALALLDSASPERGTEILQTVNTLGGSAIAVGIATQRVRKLMDERQLSEALSLVGALVHTAQDSPDAWQLAAKIYNEAGQADDARRSALEAARLFQTAGAIIEEEDSYREAITAAPDDLSIRSTLADYLVREGRPEEAVLALKDIIDAARSKNDTDILLESLNRSVQIAPGNTDLREMLALELEHIAPDSAISNWLETARLFQESDQEERAVRIYQHVLELHPSNETALQEMLNHARSTGKIAASARLTKALAEVKASRKNIGEACRLMQGHLELDPDNLDMLERLSALAGSSNNPEVFVTTTKALAQRFQKIGNHEGALKQYERLLDRNPRDARVLLSLLDCCAAAGKPELGAGYAQQLLTVAKETEDPERVRVAAATILSFDNENAEAHYDLGEALLSLNRVPEAITEWLSAGELYEAGGNTPVAYTCYRRITQVNPATLQAWKRLADIALNIGDLETAKLAVIHVIDKTGNATDARTSPLITRLLEAVPDDPQVHETAREYFTSIGENDRAASECLWLAERAMAANNAEFAESLINDGLKLSPGHADLKSTQHKLIRQMGRVEELQLRLRQEADAHEAAGRLNEAISVFRELVELAPGQIALHRELVRLLEKSGNAEDAFTQNLEVISLLLDRSELEEARELADELAARNASEFIYRERIADLLARSAFPDVAARHYLAAAKTAEAGNALDQAVDLTAKAVQARPVWAESRRALAQACEKAGRAGQAFDAWIGLTEVLLESGEYSEAAATLDRLAKQWPDRPEIREQLASLYERTGNRDKQATVLKELIETYEGTGKDAENLAAYRKLISLQPDDPALFTRYVELLAQCGSQAENLTDEYTRLADILAKRGDFEAALQTYEQVIGLSPDNTSARSRYATFLMNRGSRNRALTEMRALAELYNGREEFSAAVDVLNAALAISPRDADLCLALAKAQEAAGLHEDARVSYARATAILASTAAVKGIDTYRRILTQDENNTAVRLRLVELLINSGDKMEAAREARILAEVHISRGELHEAEHAYSLVDQCEPESLDEVRAAISRDSYDPSLQYVHYIRLGNRQMEMGDIDAALDTYRTARSLHDDEPELIQKCIDCVSLIAPEAEAIPDYLLMAEKLLTSGDFTRARHAYEQVRMIDPFNNDARCGLETVNSAERNHFSKTPASDDLVLKSGRAVSKRVALMDLLVACQEAAVDNAESQRLGG